MLNNRPYPWRNRKCNSVSLLLRGEERADDLNWQRLISNICSIKWRANCLREAYWWATIGQTGQGGLVDTIRMVDSSASVPKKGVASCDKLGLGACSLRPQDSRMRFLASGLFGNERGRAEVKHLTRRRKRKNFDTLSNGEWKGHRANRTLQRQVAEDVELWTRVLLVTLIRSCLEWRTTKSESLVEEGALQIPSFLNSVS